MSLSKKYVPFTHILKLDKILIILILDIKLFQELKLKNLIQKTKKIKEI